MPELSVDFTVAASADRVWAVIGPGFARIGEWATAIPASTAIDSDRDNAGRVCETGISLVPRVTEILTAYDDAARTLTYRAEGMPSFVTLAHNTWTVTPTAEGRCRVSLRARFDTRSLLGLLGRWAILARTRRTSRHLADDLRHYVETGQPSPRKRRAARSSARPDA